MLLIQKSYNKRIKQMALVRILKNYSLGILANSVIKFERKMIYLIYRKKKEKIILTPPSKNTSTQDL